MRNLVHWAGRNLKEVGGCSFHLRTKPKPDPHGAMDIILFKHYYYHRARNDRVFTRGLDKVDQMQVFGRPSYGGILPFSHDLHRVRLIFMSGVGPCESG